MKKKIVRLSNETTDDHLTYAVSLEDAIKDYLEAIKHLREKTRTGYASLLVKFSQWCKEKDVMLHQVNQRILNAFVEHVRTNHKPQKTGKTEISTYTLTAYAKTIKGFLSWCVEDSEYQDHVSYETVRKLKMPKLEEVLLETFSPEQIEDLFKACDKECDEHLQLRDKAIIAVLLDTGIRANELVTLTLGNVELSAQDPHVRVLGKGGKWGEVGLGVQSRRTLQKYIRIYREPTIEYDIKDKKKVLSPRQFAQLKSQIFHNSPVFVSRYGTQLTVSGLEGIIDRLERWAHIEGVRCSPHTFRHTFAVMFMRNGGDIYTLSKLLRHSSVKVTENYLKSLKQSEARHKAKSVLDNL